MGAFDGDKGNADNVDEVIEKMDWVDIDVDKALPPDLASAIKESLDWLKKNAGAEGAPADALKRVAAFLSKVAAGKYPDPKAAAADDAGDDAGGDDASKQEKCPECGADMKGEKKCPECGYEMKGVKKSDGMTVTITPEGEVQISGEPVTKGSKQFTPERIGHIGAIAKQSLALLAETDPELAKSIIAELVKAQLPADLKWTQGTHPVPASVKKEDITAAVKEVVEPLSKKVEDLGGKVEDITKSRGASQSDDAGDSTDSSSVQKNDDFWKGVPVG